MVVINQFMARRYWNRGSALGGKVMLVQRSYVDGEWVAELSSGAHPIIAIAAATTMMIMATMSGRERDFIFLPFRTGTYPGFSILQ